MMLHNRLPTWTQLALAFFGFGVVSTAQGQACETVTIEVLTDYFPGEIDWVLTGTPGPNVDTESYNWGQDGQLFTYNYCLEDGCYTFTITDTFGDGICCGFGQGYYNIYVGGTLVATGGNYNYSESYTFCLELGDCFDPEACNFNPNAESANNDLCEYAIDSYPSGLYDCDGNCYLDFDEDGICNALEIPGCQEPWACNYNPQATDPPELGLPCTYPLNDDVDCNGNSLLPQFLTQPLDETASCESIPSIPSLATQPAPAAVAYQGLFPENCYEINENLEVDFSSTVYPGSCPGNYTIEREWVITDCMGRQNALTQTIHVVDNLVPVVSSGLDTVYLGCNDPVVHPPLLVTDQCGGAVTLTEAPSFVTLPGVCPGEFVEKKLSEFTDECGNVTAVEQVIVVEDNTPPLWLSAPYETVVTDDLANHIFTTPVAEDFCSTVDLVVEEVYSQGACPLAETIVRTIKAVDACGNISAPYTQTVIEATDLEASASVTSVSCHGGNDATGEVVVQGGVSPYAVDWGGYDPEALGTGTYVIQVTDANLCQANLSVFVSEPAPFEVALTATTPWCTDPFSGTLNPTFTGGVEPISLDWAGVDPDAAAAGEYTLLATDDAGCTASASAEVLEADIPDPLVLNGVDAVVQGDSAAYYYDFTLGSDYAWTYTGAQAQQVFNSFAISLQWDSLGMQEVCVTETNEDGCVGPEVCLDVWVEDDVARVAQAPVAPLLMAYPNPAQERLTVQCEVCQAGEQVQVWNSVGVLALTFTWEGGATQPLDVKSLPAGVHTLQVGTATTAFIVE